MRSFYIFSVFLFLAWMGYSCSDDGPSGPDVNDFDRQKMLENWADNIIIPAFTSFAEETAEMHATAEHFDTEPSMANLTVLRDAWENAYLHFQQVSMFETGHAMQIRYRDNLNIYPTDPDEIHSNIESGSYNLALPSLNDSQGFPALDYLLYGLAETDDEILAYYTSGDHAGSYRNYLTSLTGRIDQLTREIITHWDEEYRDDFVQNHGNGANASADMTVNDYIFYYEKALRAGKVGIPAGVFSGTPLATHVEAYYRKGLSKELLLEALTATQDFFNGEHFNSNESGESLASYLDFLNTIKNGSDLSSMINNQFDIARGEIQNLNDNFSEQIDADNTKMLSAYEELQKNVVLLKVDMLQALNINVDYVDADGD